MQIYGNGDKLMQSSDWSNTSVGTNLLADSKNWNGITAYNAAKLTDKTYLGGRIVSLSGVGLQNSVQINNGCFPVGVPIAWSVYAKANKPATLHNEPTGGNSARIEIAVGTEWTRVSSFGSSQRSAILYFWNTTPDTEIDLCLPKIELGSVATQWCPAPEDYAMKSDLDALKAEIEQLKQK